MDRALFRDKPLKVFITIYSFLVFIFEFYFLKRYCRKVALPICVQLGEPSCKCAIGCWQLSGKFITGGKRVLVTIWQIFFRVSEHIGNPLANFPEGIGNFCKQQLLSRGLATPSNSWPEGIDYPTEQLSEGAG
jgi:hypothetical protein